MSSYYLLQESLDPKVIGMKYPQCVGLKKAYNNEYDNKRSLYYFAHSKGEKVKHKPDLNSIVVGESTKMTDLISCSLGPGKDLIVSEKLYNIFKTVKTSDLQTFDATLNKKVDSYSYKWIHFIYNLEAYTNYKRSVFFHPNDTLLEKVKEIDSYGAFNSFYNNIDKFGLINATNTVLDHKPLDLFIVGRFNQKHYVSRYLKNILEEQEISGVQFEEANDIAFVSP